MIVSKFARADDSEPRSISHIKQVALALRKKPANIQWFIGIGLNVKPYTLKEGPGRGSVIRDPLFGVMLRNLAAGHVDLNCVTIEPTDHPMLVLETLNAAGIFVVRGSLGKMLARSAPRETGWRGITDWTLKPPHCVLGRSCELINSMVRTRGIDGLQAWLACANAEYRARGLEEVELRERLPGDNLPAEFHWHLE